MRPVLDAIGLTNVTSLASVTGLDETAVVSRTLLAIDGEPQGVLRLAAEKPLTPADLKPIPADATFALAARLDADKLLDAVLAAAEKIEPLRPPEDRRRDRATPTRLRAGRQHPQRRAPLAGRHVVRLQFARRGRAGFTGLTAVVQVKDAKRPRPRTSGC